MTKATNVKANANGWTEEKTAQAIALYTAKVEAVGAAAANDTASLNEMAVELEVKSGAALRSKLVSMKVYQKGEARKVGGGTSVRKIQIVRSIASNLVEAGIIESVDELDSLESSKATALNAIAEALQIEIKA